MSACERKGLSRTGKTTVAIGVIVSLILAGIWAKHHRPDEPPKEAAITKEAESSEPAAAGGVALTRDPESWDDLDDPGADGWDSEVMSGRAQAQLKQLEKLLAGAGTITPESVEPIVAADFAGEALIPEALAKIYLDGPLSVERPPPTGPAGPDRERGYHGASGFAEALNDLTRRFDGSASLRPKFKLFQIHPGTDDFTTRQYFTLIGPISGGLRELHSTWDVRWTEADGAAPRIQTVVVSDFEQTTRSEERWFEDCTGSIVGASPCYEPQLLKGYGHWLAQIPHGSYLETMGSPGLAVGDVNGDGLEDLYLCQERGLPNRLFLRQADGTVSEVSRQWGVDWLDSSRSALLVDFDNDGDLDLAVGVMGGVALASNEGGNRFRFRRLLPTTEDVMSLAGADIDLDGDVDLYACCYRKDQQLDTQGGDSTKSGLPTGTEQFVLHDANTGGANSLFRNDLGGESGAWTFTDATEASGLGVNNQRFSYAASWEDYDNDGDQDLYVANDYGRDNLYRNEAGRFLDVAAETGVENAATGMGITWGDFDRDGWMDAYVSNMFSAAGNRVTFQPQFKPGEPSEVRSRLQRLARGNSLLKNTGNGAFLEVSEAAGVEMGRWAWASLFADLNNDGWEDLLVANGYITTEDSGDL